MGIHRLYWDTGKENGNYSLEWKKSDLHTDKNPPQQRWGSGEDSGSVKLLIFLARTVAGEQCSNTF